MEKTQEEKIKSYKKSNLKIMIPYKMLSFDLIFYYSISYLFLVNTKGLTTSQIVFADAFYPLFKLIFQLPCTIFIQKVGKKNSLVIASICVSFYIGLILGLVDEFTIIIANAFLAFAYVIRGMAESTLLQDSIEDTPKKGEIFSKYNGRSIALYYLIDSITAIIAGYLFVFNPYLPMTFSLIISIITIVLSSYLHDIPTPESILEAETKISIKTYFKELSQSFKFIAKSERLRALISFNALMASILSLTVTLQRSLLDDANVPSEKTGIIFAVMGIIAFLSSNYSVSIHNKFHNKTLVTMGIAYITSIIISASVLILDLPLFLMYYILLITLAIQFFIKGPYYTLIQRYLNSFCDSDMRLKIYSAKALIEFLIGTAISIFCSLLLKYLSNASATLVLGLISFVLIIFLANYMSSRVGLKPEEYNKKDIFY